MGILYQIIGKNPTKYANPSALMCVCEGESVYERVCWCIGEKQQILVSYVTVPKDLFFPVCRFWEVGLCNV